MWRRSITRSLSIKRSNASFVPENARWETEKGDTVDAEKIREELIIP
jgi:hypothetical protein